MSSINPSNLDQQSAVQRPGRLWFIGFLLSAVVIVLIGLTAVLTPESTPAFDTAVEFMNAAGSGDDATANARLSAELLNFVRENCPQASVSACVDDYTPPEWGDLIRAVFRRSIPAGENAWDILVVSTYELAQGFSGVCTYFRVERESMDWKIVRWSGFISCDEPNAGLTALRDNADASNNAP